MTVKELIKALLVEAGEAKLGSQVYDHLDDNEFASLHVGACPEGEPTQYIERICNESPSHVDLICEEP